MFTKPMVPFWGRCATHFSLLYWLSTHGQVTKKPSLGGGVWADGSIFAVGDCNYGCIGEPGNWEMPPVPKISYPGEEQAYHACLNVMKLASLSERIGERCLCQTASDYGKTYKVPEWSPIIPCGGLP